MFCCAWSKEIQVEMIATYNLRQISWEGLGNPPYSCLFPSPHFNVGSVSHVAREFPWFFDLHTFNIEVGGGGRRKDAEL